MTALLVLVALIGLAWAQVWSIVTVAGTIGIGWTLLAMAAFAVGGLWMVGRQGAAVARRARADLLAGRPAPGAGLDGLLLLVAGALLLVPGFVTAGLGLLLVLPPVRAVARRPLQRWWSRRVERRVGPLSRFGTAGFGTGGFGTGRFTVRTIVIDDGGPAGPRRGVRPGGGPPRRRPRRRRPFGRVPPTPGPPDRRRRSRSCGR